VTNGAFVDLGVHQDGLVHIPSCRTGMFRRVSCKVETSWSAVIGVDQDGASAFRKAFCPNHRAPASEAQAPAAQPVPPLRSSQPQLRPQPS
jgi:hypothetical protein